MPDSSSSLYSNAQTVVRDAKTFAFETLEQDDGRATVIRFDLDDTAIKLGDVLLVLTGADVSFHGMIREVGHGSAVAADRTSSLIASR